MPDRDVAVSVRGLSKRYTLRHDGQKPDAAGALVAAFRNLRQRPPTEAFWALRDINFDIPRGAVGGIVGANGAGKSTLLKVLSRVTEPTTGRIDLYGRVGSLLEVGTGFHPDLTGEENIYLNGAILGMSKAEITHQFDAIVAFAEVEPFLNTPVKRYSSGMYVRLAFAVAAHLNPEILIVDEVLAVGDVQFQRKCLGKMEDVAQQEGRTVLFVSHQVAPIQQLCSHLMVFAQGRLIYQGSVEDGLATYLEQVTTRSDQNSIDWQSRDATNREGMVKFIGFHLLHETPATCPEFMVGEKIGLAMTVYCEKPVSDVCVGYTILDLYGTALFTSHHNDLLDLNALPAGKTEFQSWIDPNYLQPGRYVVQLGVFVNSVGQDFVGNVTQIEILSLLGSPDAKLDRRPGILRFDFPWYVMPVCPTEANHA